MHAKALASCKSLRRAIRGRAHASHRRRTERCHLSLKPSPDRGTAQSTESLGYQAPYNISMAEASEDVQEPGFDPQIRDLAGWAGKVIYWTVWPIGIAVYYLVYYISFAVLFVLKLVYRPLEFILLPIFYLLSFILNCLLAPFQFLARFEVNIAISNRVGMSDD